MSDSDVDKFLADTKKEGVLAPWENQIFELLAKKASYEKIRRFLEIKNVKAVRSQIENFVKAKKRSDLYEKAMQERGKPIQPKPAQDEPVPQGTQLKEPTPIESPNQNRDQTKNTPLSTDIPKFEWDVKNKPKSRW